MPTKTAVMTPAKAQRVAIDCMQKCLRLIAFDANIARIDPNAPPMARKRLEEYERIKQAIATLIETEKP